MRALIPFASGWWYRDAARSITRSPLSLPAMEGGVEEMHADNRAAEEA